MRAYFIGFYFLFFVFGFSSCMNLTSSKDPEGIVGPSSIEVSILNEEFQGNNVKVYAEVVSSKPLILEESVLELYYSEVGDETENLTLRGKVPLSSFSSAYLLEAGELLETSYEFDFRNVAAYELRLQPAYAQAQPSNSGVKISNIKISSANCPLSFGEQEGRSLKCLDAISFNLLSNKSQVYNELNLAVGFYPSSEDRLKFYPANFFPLVEYEKIIPLKNLKFARNEQKPVRVQLLSPVVSKDDTQTYVPNIRIYSFKKQK